MTRRSNIANITAACIATVSLATVSGLSCGSSDGGGGNASCSMFTNYNITTPDLLSFATDVYPILANTTPPGGCSQALICHGQPTMKLDNAGTKFLTFVFGTSTAPVMDPAMAREQLMMNAAHAPAMKRVAPGSVGNSFLAYKIAKDRNGLACTASMCQPADSVSLTQPCGDLMPSLGAETFTDAQRNKILDWIGQGAAP